MYIQKIILHQHKEKKCETGNKNDLITKPEKDITLSGPICQTNWRVNKTPYTMNIAEKNAASV